MNIPKIGIVYHVVDKNTSKVIKVGSTAKSIKIRFRHPDYKRKYKHHFLKSIRVIKSSESDWYEPNNPLCPFLWHLVAIEHIEMIKAGTYRKGPLSNQVSPLTQKASGLDGVIGGQIGGKIGGKTTARKYFTREHQSEAGKARGRSWKKYFTQEHQSRVGRLGGTVARDSGQLASVCSLGGKAIGAKNMHVRWHVKRGIVSSNCKFCVSVEC